MREINTMGCAPSWWVCGSYHSYVIKSVLIGRDRVRNALDYFDGLDLTRNYAIIATVLRINLTSRNAPINFVFTFLP